MDRNITKVYSYLGCFSVALRKESVDRNIMTTWTIEKTIKSLSARRAWIEIIASMLVVISHCLSLSARRAWIEIVESGEMVKQFDGRSPQGERG